MDGGDNRRLLQGYVTHDSFAGLAMPATFQNLAMRDYVGRIGARFKLSADEILLPNCHMTLYSMVRAFPDIGGIVMCSLFMLPADPADRRWIYDRALEHGCELHCILESTVIRSEADVERAEEILALKAALDHCPTGFDAALLPKLDVLDDFS